MDATALTAHSLTVLGNRPIVLNDAGMIRISIDIIPEAAVVFGLDGTIIAVNPAALKVFEAESEEQLLGKCIYSMGSTISREIISHLGLGDTIHYDLEIVTLRGNRVTLDIVNIPILGLSGELTRVLGFGREVTGQRRAEREQALLASIVQSTDDGIVSVSSDMRLMSWNAGAQRLLGYSPEEAIGQPIDFYVPEDYREQAKRKLRDELTAAYTDHQAVARSEMRLRRKDGTFVEVSLVASGIYDSARRPLGLSGIFTDITERRNSERSLLKTEAELRSRLRQQAVVAHLGQRALGRIEPKLLMNEALALIAETLAVECSAILELQRGSQTFMVRAAFGWDQELVDRFTLDSTPDYQAGYAILTGEPILVRDYASETRFARTPGQIKNNLVSGLSLVIPGGDRPYGTLSLNSKTTREFSPDDVNFVQAIANIVAETLDRHKFEEDLSSARDAALEAARAKSAFLATMSHEIRTPLSAIIGLVGLLLETQLTAEQRDFMEHVRISGDTLLDTINNVLDFSKMSAGKFQIEKVQFDPRALVASSADLVLETARKKGLELEVKIEDTVPPVLSGDPGRLRQVFINLLSNAVKFTERGKVTLSAKVDSESDDYVIVRFEVADTGIGIQPGARALLFQPFFQADSSTSRKYGGTGLGLAICGQLVELMGGTIGVSGQLRQGTTFWFLLPFENSARRASAAAGASLDTLAHASLELAPRASTAQSDSARAAPPALSSECRILLAEDNPVNRKIGLAQLKKLGYRADAVNNGREALAATAHSPYHLILMDCQMPEMDGYDATAAIRVREGSSRHTVVVAMTAYSLHGDREKCLAAGMDDYISKPVRVEHLKEVLGRWLPAGSAAARNGAAAGAPEKLESAQAVLDPEVVAKLREEGEDFFRELAELFERDFREQLARLDQALAGGNLDTASRLAHTFKGTAGMLGALRMQEQAAAIELSARAGHTDEGSAMLPKFRAECERVCEALKSDPALQS